MIVAHNYTLRERIDMATWLRRLAKDMVEDDPVAAAKLISAARMIERQSPIDGALVK